MCAVPQAVYCSDGQLVFEKATACWEGSHWPVYILALLILVLFAVGFPLGTYWAMRRTFGDFLDKGGDFGKIFTTVDANGVAHTAANAADLKAKSMKPVMGGGGGGGEGKEGGMPSVDARGAEDAPTDTKHSSHHHKLYDRRMAEGLQQYGYLLRNVKISVWWFRLLSIPTQFALAVQTVIVSDVSIRIFIAALFFVINVCATGIILPYSNWWQNALQVGLGIGKVASALLFVSLSSDSDSTLFLGSCVVFAVGLVGIAVIRFGPWSQKIRASGISIAA